MCLLLFSFAGHFFLLLRQTTIIWFLWFISKWEVQYHLIRLRQWRGRKGTYWKKPASTLLWQRSGMYVLFVAKSSPPSSSPSLSCCRLCLPSNGTSSSSNITVNWYHPAPKTFCWTIPYTKYPTIPLTNNRMGTNHTLEVPVVDLEANTNME